MMDDLFDDPLLEHAIEWVVTNQRAYISGIQRYFRIGYNRASRLVELMERIGVVSPQGVDGNRNVFCSELTDAHTLLQQFKEYRGGKFDITNLIKVTEKK